ncbi:MAG: hypothetical protein HY961_03965 [Ignavibacteriae bacterium]|nr:hypothetical protein [Ignavibacteriota bacterium]
MKRFVSMLLLFSSVAAANAQKLNDFVSKYGNANGVGYMQPLADAFGANINSGVYQSARIPLGGFHLTFSVMLMAAPVTESRKTFSATTEGFFAPQQKADVPTIFGSTEGKTVVGNAGTAYAFPGGLNMTTFAVAVPQITIGSFRGTEGTIRFFQAKLGDNIGELQLWGIGARHNINQYFKKLPLDIAFGIYQHHFEIGDIVSANATLISAQASYPWSVFTFYGGPAVEISNMDVNYDGTSGKIALELKSQNSVRFTVGTLVSLAFFRLFADYNLASQPAFVLGLGFGF